MVMATHHALLGRLSYKSNGAKHLSAAFLQEYCTMLKSCEYGSFSILRGERAW